MPDGTAELVPKPSLKALMREAEARAKAGALDGAAVFWREIIRRYPGNVRARAALREIEASPPALPRGRTLEDEAALAALVDASKAGRSAEVVERAGPLLAAYPEFAILHAIAGVAHSRLGRGDRAVAHLTRARALRPDHAETAFNLGVALQAMDRRGEAIAAFATATELDPGYAAAWNNMGGVFQAAGDHGDALAAYERAVAADPSMVEALNNRGNARQTLGDMRGAISDYEEALRRDPGHVNVYFNIAHALKLMGEGAAAKTCLWQVVKLDPGEAKAARELAMIVKGDEAEGLRPVVEGLLAPANPPATRMHGTYAAAYLDFAAGRDAEGVERLGAAGGIAKALAGYRIERDRALFEAIRAGFSPGPEPLDARPAEVTPIFIVGMPRSGTSLTEEILARHSAVVGAGELEYLRMAVQEAGDKGAAPDAASLAALRKSYLRRLSAHAVRGAAHVTDKMPLNFRFVGHILTALPEAKVVHLRRSPEAVCWSNHKIYFPAPGMAFTSTQGDVAAYWHLYSGLMAFWEKRFPGRIVHVDYEALTDDPEGGARALLGDLGLAWEDGVLAVEKSARSVRTASALQVKQGIYKGSSDAWRRYEPWLGEMLSTLRNRAAAP